MLRISRLLQMAGMCVWLVFGWGAGTFVAAEENILGLSDNVYYDIYLGGGDEGGTLIRHVKIMGVREVSGLMFLVVSSDGFNLTQAGGLIALNQIKAILPVNRFVSVPASSHSKGVR